MATYLDHPFHFDGRGRAAVTGTDDHLRDLIYQVLFTQPGERVNLPDFGCGLYDLVFGPASDAMVTSAQFLVQGALERWLGDLIQVHQVTVAADDARLEVEVVYTALTTGLRQTQTFATAVGQ